MMFFMYQDDEGRWRWQLMTVNEQVLAECPTSYPRKEDCRAAIQRVKDCRTAHVHER